MFDAIPVYRWIMYKELFNKSDDLVFSLSFVPGLLLYGKVGGKAWLVKERERRDKNKTQVAA